MMQSGVLRDRVAFGTQRSIVVSGVDGEAFTASAQDQITRYFEMHSFELGLISNSP